MPGMFIETYDKEGEKWIHGYGTLEADVASEPEDCPRMVCEDTNGDVATVRIE